MLGASLDLPLVSRPWGWQKLALTQAELSSGRRGRCCQGTQEDACGGKGCLATSLRFLSRSWGIVARDWDSSVGWVYAMVLGISAVSCISAKRHKSLSLQALPGLNIWIDCSRVGKLTVNNLSGLQWYLWTPHVSLKWCEGIFEKETLDEGLSAKHLRGR